MNNKKAIKILKKQESKISKLEEYQKELFMIETRKYILEIFGKESLEYNFSTKIWLPKGLEEQYKHSDYSEFKYIREFIRNSINTIETIGIYKEKKVNWFSELNNLKIVLMLFSFIVFGFGVGYWVREYEVFSILFRMS